MKIKQFISTALIGTMILGLVTSCTQNGEDAKNEKQVQLNMAWWGNKIRNERTQKVLELYQEEFPNVTIEGRYFPSKDYWDKMMIFAAGRDMPDLCQMGYNYLSLYAKKGLLLDLTPYIEKGILKTSDIEKEILEMGKIDDGIYGIASGMNAQCLLYNKTLTDECGVTLKDNMTMEEFVEIAKKVTKQTGYRANLCPIDGYTFMRQWSRAEGISIQGETVPVDSSEEYVPFFEILEDGIEDGWHLVPDYGDMTAVETDPLVYGSIPQNMAWCTVHGGSNLLVAFQAAASEETEIGITTIPTSNPKKSNFVQPSMFFSISSNTENPEEAVKVLDYLIHSPEANRILLAERGIPVSRVALEEVIKNISGIEKKSIDFVNKVILPNSSKIDPPDPEGTIALANELEDILEKVAEGDYTAEKAAQKYYEKELELWGKIID